MAFADAVSVNSIYFICHILQFPLYCLYKFSKSLARKTRWTCSVSVAKDNIAAVKQLPENITRALYNN